MAQGSIGSIRKVAVEEYTTPSPFTVKKETPIQEIVLLMREHGFRHIPVLDEAGSVVGIISDGDVKLAATFKEAQTLTADDIMSEVVFLVDPQTPIDEVAFSMSKHKYGSAIVQGEHGDFMGIFTVTDALNALVEVLRGDI